MDLSNLPYSQNIEDRRYAQPAYPSRMDVIWSLIKGLTSAPPAQGSAQTWNGDPNMQPGQLPALGSKPAGVPQGGFALDPVIQRLLGR